MNLTKFFLLFLFVSQHSYASVLINKMYQPIESSHQTFSNCDIRFQPHPGTNTKILIMTYADTAFFTCPYAGQSTAFQCDSFFCHSGSTEGYKTNYIAIYSSADSARLLVRVNHCKSGCKPFGFIKYLPLRPEDANYELLE